MSSCIAMNKMSNETQSIRDTCNSLNWILQSSLDFVTHQFFQQKNPKECTRGTHDFLVGTRQNFIIQGSLVNTYFFKSINTILSCLKIKFQYTVFHIKKYVDCIMISHKLHCTLTLPVLVVTLLLKYHHAQVLFHLP